MTRPEPSELGKLWLALLPEISPRRKRLKL
jgi:hypothetical protein